MKTCIKCGETRPLEEFTKQWHKGAQKYYYAAGCKVCKAKWQREYRAKYPERYRASNTKTVIGKYNMTVEEYNSKVEQQNGKCAICEKSPAKGRLAIDHNHNCCEKGSCGKCTRSLLCQSCNGALGLVSDNQETLLRMIEYLRKWNIEDRDLVAV